MAASSGPEPLSESAFIGEVTRRVNLGLTEEKQLHPTIVRLVVKAFKEEVIDCLKNGYKVTLNGLVRFEPKYVTPKPKGEMVRNPGTGETAPRAAAIPASFTSKAFMSSAIKKVFPSTKTKAGIALAEQLAPKPKAAPKKAGTKVKK